MVLATIVELPAAARGAVEVKSKHDGSRTSSEPVTEGLDICTPQQWLERVKRFEHTEADLISDEYRDGVAALLFQVCVCVCVSAVEGNTKATHRCLKASNSGFIRARRPSGLSYCPSCLKMRARCLVPGVMTWLPVTWIKTKIDLKATTPRRLLCPLSVSSIGSKSSQWLCNGCATTLAGNKPDL